MVAACGGLEVGKPLVSCTTYGTVVMIPTDARRGWSSASHSYCVTCGAAAEAGAASATGMAAGAGVTFFATGFGGFGLAVGGFGATSLAAKPNSDESGALWLTPPA